MECRGCLVLHKSLWEHLKNQAGQLKSDVEARQFLHKQEYHKALDEQSKQWTKNWPDTLEGRLAQVDARKERQRQRDKLFVKIYKEKQKATDHEQAVADAKQKIFNTSNYGHQLISAVRESKAIEERKSQIEFKKLLKKKAKELDELTEAQIASMQNNMFDFDKKHIENLRKREKALKEQAETNKMMFESREHQLTKAREEEWLGELEDARLQKINLEYEAHEMEHYCKEKAIMERKQYEADQKAFKEGKMQRDEEDDALIKVWTKYHDKVRSREKLTWEKIINGRGGSEYYKKAYKLAEKYLEDKNQAYEDFIAKGIERMAEQHLTQQENKGMNKKLKAHQKQALEDYKAAIEFKDILKHCNKCSCDKISLFTKPCKRIIKKVLGEDKNDAHKPDSFLVPYTKLTDDLKKRSGESSWSAGTENAYFAKQAASSIAECQYKHMAKKVVENYKKNYNLVSTTSTLDY